MANIWRALLARTAEGGYPHTEWQPDQF